MRTLLFNMTTIVTVKILTFRDGTLCTRGSLRQNVRVAEGGTSRRDPRGQLLRSPLPNFRVLSLISRLRNRMSIIISILFYSTERERLERRTRRCAFAATRGTLLRRIGAISSCSDRDVGVIFSSSDQTTNVRHHANTRVAIRGPAVILPGGDKSTGVG